MDIIYQNKIIASLCVGSFIALLFYNYNKINNNNDNNDNNNVNIRNSIFVLLVTSIIMYSLLYKTEENIDNVLDEIDKGDPNF
jgi:hypothetical protein